VAIGLERTLFAAPTVAAPERRRLVFVVWLTEAELEAAEDLAERLRSTGVAAQIDYDSGKLKGQFKSADAAKAAACIIVGPDELKKGVYSLKDLATGEQREVRSDQAIEAVRMLFRD
jgi:histidyl-tRNA synthetase